MKIGLAALAALLVASPALSANGDNPFAKENVVLDLRGLNLASVDGQHRLANRMDQAANAVCGEGMSSIHLALGAQARECYREVMADLRTRIAAETAAGGTTNGVQLAQR